ncbi:MAG: hypothetical protein COA43_09135 [Robiginitomaculum sp.]|nr:MAG: hypothetical protein COA43_09135 [Robiginitomaculum sp.]
MHNKPTLNVNTSRFTVKASLATVMAAGLMFSALPAQAMVFNNSRVSIVVKTQDLKTDAGIAKVYQAMTVKAQTSCEEAGFLNASSTRMTSLREKYANKRCSTRLLSSFIRDLGDERLRAYHAAIKKRR